MKNVIFDLDGTLANINERKRFITGELGYKSWKKFFCPKEVAKDKPITQVINVAKMYKKSGYKLFIFTGRDEVSRDVTEAWLAKQGVEFDILLMRSNGDYTADNLLKKRWVGEYFSNPSLDVEAVYDDRDKVVKMWREMGIQTFQVDYGDF